MPKSKKPQKKVIKKSVKSPLALVAGGAGFIGSYLVGALLEKKARVIVLDNYETGNEDYIKDYLGNPNFALYNVDINQGIPPEIESVDYIFHLAGVEEYVYSKDYINLDSLLTNSYGTKNLLDLAQKSQAKFVLASSIDVYQGRMSQLDLDEYFGTTQEADIKYSLVEAKRYAEALVWEYYKRHGLDARIVRLPEVYGPKMSLDASGVLGVFMKDLLEGRNLTIYGDGYEKEYYLYISDAVSGLLRAFFLENTSGKIYSLVGGESSSTLEVAFMLKGLAEGNLSIQFRPGDTSARPKRLSPDSLNLRALGWKSQVHFKQGVTKTLARLGYVVNEYGFKPSKLIAEKETRKKRRIKLKSRGRDDSSVLTLQDLKPVRNKGPRSLPAKVSVAKPSTGVSAAPETLKELEVPEVSEMAPVVQIHEDTSLLESSPVDSPGDSVMAEASMPAAPLPASRAISANIPSPDGARLFSRRKRRMGPRVLKKKANRAHSERIKKPHISVSTSLVKQVFGVFLGVLFSAALAFLVLPSLRFYFSLRAGLKDMENVRAGVYTFNAEQVATSAESSYENLYKAREYLDNVKWVFFFRGKKQAYYSYDKLLSSLVHFSKAAYSSSEVIAPFENLWEVILPTSSVVMDQTGLGNASSELPLIKTQLRLASIDLTSVDSAHIPDAYKKHLEEYSFLLEVGLEEMDSVATLITELPEILGMEGARKYIVWFQNSNELRATGGFIGSYGVLDFSDGKLAGLTIDDIYNPDGQLDVRNITVPPPKQIADYLVEDRLYLRNSNWNPDFPSSAETFKDLYFTVTGETVDGVLAVDLDFTKALLDAVGPVFLTAYNEEITSENLYERAQLYAEFNYEEGSDQKKSFLTILGSKLLEKIFSLDRDGLPVIVDSITSSLAERHFLIYMPDLSISAYIKKKGWDGSIVSHDENYLYVVNSNLGGNKADYFVEPEMNLEVDSLTRDGLLRGTLTLSYVHSGTDTAWPGGVYKDYIRVYMGKGSMLTAATVEDASGDARDIFSDVALYEESGKTVFGYGIEVAPQTTTTLVLGFDLPKNLAIAEDRRFFDLYWQKQPGSHNTKSSFVFTPPFGMEVAGMSSGVTSVGKVVKWTDHLNRDQNLSIQLQ
jgi:nucleoside-diphosphate-sugar epimerase